MRGPLRNQPMRRGMSRGLHPCGPGTCRKLPGTGAEIPLPHAGEAAPGSMTGTAITAGDDGPANLNPTSPDSCRRQITTPNPAEPGQPDRCIGWNLDRRECTGRFYIVAEQRRPRTPRDGAPPCCSGCSAGCGSGGVGHRCRMHSCRRNAGAVAAGSHIGPPCRQPKPLP